MHGILGYPYGGNQSRSVSMVPSIAEISHNFWIITPTRFAIYFDTLGVRDMQFSELICKSYINMDHLGINVDQFLWVPSIA